MEKSIENILFKLDFSKTLVELKTVKKADLILVTHGHGDHLGDSVAAPASTY